MTDTEPTPPAEPIPAAPAPGTPSAILTDEEKAGEPVATATDETPDAATGPPEGAEVLGGELEAALRERAAKAASEDGSAPKYWTFNGEYFKLRPIMPAGAMLAVLQAQRKKQPGHMLESVVAFFEEGEGDRFIAAVTDFSADLLIDMEYLQGLIRDLFRAFGQRPLDK